MNVKIAMKVSVVFLLMGSILFIQGCAKTQSVKMSAVASREQRTAYDGTIISRKKHIVSLSPYAELGGAVFNLSKYKTIFMLSVENCDKEPISIGFDNITVILEGNSKDLVLKKISVQSYDDFIKDFETLYNDYEKTFIYNTIYDYYRLWEDSQLMYEASDGEAQFITAEELTDRMYVFERKIINMRAQNKAFQDMLPGYILKQKTIIKPGTSYSGIVICDTHDLDPKIEGSFQITVSVDGEEHRFTFNHGLR